MRLRAGRFNEQTGGGSGRHQHRGSKILCDGRAKLRFFSKNWVDDAEAYCSLEVDLRARLACGFNQPAMLLSQRATRSGLFRAENFLCDRVPGIPLTSLSSSQWQRSAGIRAPEQNLM